MYVLDKYERQKKGLVLMNKLLAKIFSVSWKVGTFKIRELKIKLVSANTKTCQINERS